MLKKILVTLILTALCTFLVNAQSIVGPAACFSGTPSNVGQLSTPAQISPTNNQNFTASGATASVNFNFNIDNRTDDWRLMLYKGTGTPSWNSTDGFECGSASGNVTHYKKNNSTILNFSRNLTPGTYWITVHSWAAGIGQSYYSTRRKFTVTAASTCNTPSPSVTTTTTNSIRVSWSSTGASSYEVERRLASGGAWTTVVNSTTSTSRNVTGLSSSTAYDFRVRSNCSSSTSSWGNTSGTTDGVSCSTPNISTYGATSSQITITWTNTGALNYTLEKSTNGSTWSFLANQSSRTFTDNGLSESTTYYYRVKSNCTGGVTSSYDNTNASTTAAAFDFAPSSVNVACSTATQNIAVTATGSWSASESESWFSLGSISGSGSGGGSWGASTSGNGNGSFQVILDRNDGTSTRYGTITMVNGSKTKYISVTQGAGCKILYVDIEQIRFFADDITESGGVFTLKDNVYSISHNNTSPLPTTRRNFDMVEWLGTTKVTPTARSIQSTTTDVTSFSAVKVSPISSSPSTFYVPTLSNTTLGKFIVQSGTDKFEYAPNQTLSGEFEKVAGFPLKSPTFQLANQTSSNTLDGLKVEVGFSLPDIIKDIEANKLATLNFDQFDITRSGYKKKFNAELNRGFKIGDKVALEKIGASYDNTSGNEIVFGVLAGKLPIMSIDLSAQFFNARLKSAEATIGGVGIPVSPVVLTGGSIKLDHLTSFSDNGLVQIAANFEDPSGIVQGRLDGAYKVGVGMRIKGNVGIDKFIPDAIKGRFLFLPQLDWYSVDAQVNLSQRKSIFDINITGESGFAYGDYLRQKALMAYAGAELKIKDRTWLSLFNKSGGVKFSYQFFPKTSSHDLSGIMTYNNDKVYAFQLFDFLNSSVKRNF